MHYTILLWMEDENKPPTVITPFWNKKELTEFKNAFFPMLQANFEKMSVITTMTPERALKEAIMFRNGNEKAFHGPLRQEVTTPNRRQQKK